VWTNLLSELKVTGGDDAGKRSPLFATHPAVDTRRGELQALIKPGPNKLGEQEYNAAIAPHRFDWMQDEIKRGQFEESLAIFDRMLAKNPSDVQATYSRGEVYRLRGGPGDVDRALRDLSIAAEAPACPPEAFRGLGLVQRQRQDAGSAQAAFQKYLVASPEAADASLVKSYLAELQP
jgi:tetratricopeptide (TPR) repeat protein